MDVVEQILGVIRSVSVKILDFPSDGESHNSVTVSDLWRTQG